MGEQVSNTAGLNVCHSRSVWKVLPGLKQWTPVNSGSRQWCWASSLCPQARGRLCSRLSVGFVNLEASGVETKAKFMRLPSPGWLRKRVPLQKQCLLSCLHSYPSSYYKMFFRFLGVSNCDTAVTHVSVSLAALHWKENKSKSNCCTIARGQFYRPQQHQNKAQTATIR